MKIVLQGQRGRARGKKMRHRILTRILTLALIIGFMPVVSLSAAADDGPGVSLGSATHADDGKYYYENATVTGTGIQTVFIGFSDNVTTGDAITLPDTAPTGFTVSASSATNPYTKRINLAAGITADAVQSYLRGVGFSMAGLTQSVTVTVTTDSLDVDTFYNIDTQHYYQFISDIASAWTAAYNLAKNRTFMGRTGYLATVTSLAEDTFINSLSGSKVGWLGGTILTNSGIADGTQYYNSFNTTSVVSTGWYWACGPEIGTTFYSTISLRTEGEENAANAAAKDAANTAHYHNWGRGSRWYEPNNETAFRDSDDGNYETCLTTLYVTNGLSEHDTAFSWNDKSYNSAGSGEWNAKGYFVEYGNQTPGDSSDSSGSTTFATDSALLNRVYTITYNLNGGANPDGAPTAYIYGTGATLPTPTKADHAFAGWYENAGFSDAPMTTIGTADTGDKVFYARWAALGSGTSTGMSYRTTASAGAGGSISPDGTVRVSEGGSKTFTITPDEGYYIFDVLIDGVSAGATDSYTFHNITASHTIEAIFARIPGLPYYLNNGETFIGFAAEADGKMRYIKPDGVRVMFKENPKDFTDTDGHWAKSYIDFVTEREIFVGISGDLFSPDTGMTRAMFAAVVGRLYERSFNEITDSGERAFTDCNYGDYYGKYVDWATENDILEGIGDNRFVPEQEITREQTAAILYRFADFLGILPEATDAVLTYPDAESISEYAQPAVLYCQATGIIPGCDGGVFAPGETATRAEVAVILERFVESVLS